MHTIARGGLGEFHASSLGQKNQALRLKLRQAPDFVYPQSGEIPCVERPLTRKGDLNVRDT
jgi:hypothetical protein